ncbi:MAG: hypothetical protein ACRDGE_00535 [Candidatus Limnocylindria bacterium]
MSEHRPAQQRPRVEDLLVFLLIALPIFLVSVLIIVLVVMLGSARAPLG